MPVISKRHIEKSQKEYKCDGCFLPIPVGSSYKSLFGSAFEGQDPYTLRICETCWANLGGQKWERGDTHG